MKEELLGVMVRARGDAKVKIEGLDLDAQGRRVRISIVKPVAVEDEVEGYDNWFAQGCIGLRLAELDELIAKLQAARSYLA